jgi:hypothetical protein
MMAVIMKPHPGKSPRVQFAERGLPLSIDDPKHQVKCAHFYKPPSTLPGLSLRLQRARLASPGATSPMRVSRSPDLET